MNRPGVVGDTVISFVQPKCAAIDLVSDGQQRNGRASSKNVRSQEKTSPADVPPGQPPDPLIRRWLLLGILAPLGLSFHTGEPRNGASHTTTTVSSAEF